MSTLKVDGIRSNSASSDAITLASDGTCTANVTNRSNKNLIINGQFDVWQRAIDSGSNTTDGYLAADRWVLASSGATKQVTRQTFTLGQTDVPSNPKYFLRYAVTTGNNNCALRQRIEGVDKVQGAVTLSFWAKGTNPAGGSFDITNRQNFGTGGSASNVVDTGVGNFTVTSSWAKKTFTFTPPSISGKTLGTANNDYYELEIFRQPAGDTGTAAYTIDIANVQLELGSVATDFEHRSYSDEFQRCERYYQDWKDYTHAAHRGLDSSYDGHIIIDTLRINMRANPTVTATVYGWIANGNSWVDGSTSEAASLHNDPSGTFPGRYIKITGVWNWDSNYNNTVAVWFQTCKFDAEL